MNNVHQRRIFGTLLSTAAFLCLPLSGLAHAQNADAEPSAEMLAEGRVLIEDSCGACHSVTVDDESAHEDAPALRKLSASYPVEALAEALAEGIMTGHPDMPVLDFQVEEIDQIIAYLESIQEN